MTRKKLLAAILGMVCAVGARGADRRDAQGVLDRFRSIRPQAADLAIYQLDWAPTFQAAKERAAQEGRPVLLIVVTNSFGDVCTGHC